MLKVKHLLLDKLILLQNKQEFTELPHSAATRPSAAPPGV
jgi:hypothetical protein